MMKFKTVLIQAGKTATGIKVPENIVEALGHGKRPPVVVSINKYTYRSTIAVMHGDFMLPVAAEHREKAGISAGQQIEVTLSLDLEVRDVEIPDELKKALKAKAGALKIFEGLSYSRRKEFVRQVTDAKTQETRDKRIAKILMELK